MDETMRFRCAQALIDLVDEHAKRERRSRSSQLRVIVEDWLMDRGKKHANPANIDVLDAPEMCDLPDRQTADEFAAATPAGSMLVDTRESYNAQAGE